MSDPTNPFVLVPGDPVTARVEAERAIADVLAGHGLTEGFVGTEGHCVYRNYICTCGWWSTADQEQTHRTHVASLLADLMAERQAEAWDGAYATGSTDCARFLGWATSEVPDARPKDRTNPFRPRPEGHTR